MCSPYVNAEILTWQVLAFQQNGVRQVQLLWLECWVLAPTAVAPVVWGPKQIAMICKVLYATLHSAANHWCITLYLQIGQASLSRHHTAYLVVQVMSTVEEIWDAKTDMLSCVLKFWQKSPERPGHAHSVKQVEYNPHG